MFPPYPLYAATAHGCRVVDVDGVERIDFINNFSSQIHGHAHPEIARAVEAQLGHFTSSIMPTESEIRLAELLRARAPGLERLRFCNSGTEALMIAAKVARAHTGRPGLMKLEGAYHGQYPELEVSVGADPASWGPLEEPAPVPFGAGVPPGLYQHVVIGVQNREEITRALIRKYADRLAAVFVDPLPSRMQFAGPTAEFLQALREECDRHGILLVFDEVYAFRAGYRGAQGRVGVTPDLTTLGKIIGGGFAVGAVGGRADVMSVFARTTVKGWPMVQQGGTFTANPITMHAGLRALELLTPEAFERLESQGNRLRAGLRAAAQRAGLPVQVYGAASLSGVALCREPFDSYRDMVRACGPTHAARMTVFHREMLNHGVLIGPAGVFVGSTPMTDADIDATVAAAEASFGVLARTANAA
jgi:glutamate-1-semialdehyde 2,1-aminomutase